MYAHIKVLTAGVRCKLEGRLDGGTRVLRVGANQNNLADIAVVNLALCLGVGLVKAAHEAKLENQVGMRLDDLLGSLALCNVRAERLLAENVLAVVHRDLDLLAVQEGRGNDNDRVRGLHLRRRWPPVRSPEPALQGSSRAHNPDDPDLPNQP